MADVQEGLVSEGAPAHGRGVQRVYRFQNGYGASVIRTDFSYGGKEGLWELAVVRWSDDSWSIVYDTPVTSDVLGRLSDADVSEALAAIRVLPAPAEDAR